MANLIQYLPKQQECIICGVKKNRHEFTIITANNGNFYSYYLQVYCIDCENSLEFNKLNNETVYNEESFKIDNQPLFSYPILNKMDEVIKVDKSKNKYLSELDITGLTDKYCTHLLYADGFNISDMKNYPAILSIKRMIIKIKRTIDDRSKKHI